MMTPRTRGVLEVRSRDAQRFALIYGYQPYVKLRLAT